jgi:hypothetical protein
MKTETIKVVIIAVCYTILAVVLLVLMQLNAFAVLEPIAFGIFHFSSLSYPFLLGAICTLAILHIIKTLYEGSHVIVISKILALCSGASFFYFLALNIPELSSNSTLGFYILLATILASTYYGADRILRASNQITLQTITKSIILILVAFVSSAIVLTYSPQSSLYANMSLSGFIFAGLTNSGYPFRFTDKPATRKMGKWLSKDIIGSIVIGVLIAFYIFYVHPIVYAIDPTITLIAEWLFVGLVVLGSYLSIRSKVTGISAPLILETWKKHQQELNFKTTKELTDLTENIDEFITYGNKNYILLYLTNFLFEKKVNIEDINAAIDGLINYQDAKPKLFFKWDQKLINNLNMQNRNETLLKAIKNVQETYSEEIERGEGKT